MIKSRQIIQKREIRAAVAVDAPDAGLKVRFVSTTNNLQIEGIDIIKGILKEQKIDFDYFEYKVTNKSEVRKPINPMVKNGPTEKIIVEDKIDVNSNLKTIGQLEWRILKDPENVLLVQLSRLKGDPFCLPIIFPRIIKHEHPILVTGVTKHNMLQLLAKPDFNFAKIPKIIDDDPDLKAAIMARVGRTKSMQSTARDLIDFQGLPEKISTKITTLSLGKKAEFTEAEAVNVILIADLMSRYTPVFKTFQEDVINRRGTVTQLANQFKDLTIGISTRFMLDKFEKFLGEDGPKAKNPVQLFALLFRQIVNMKAGKVFAKDESKPLEILDLFVLLRSVICIARSMSDPDVWRQCLFFTKPSDAGTNEKSNLKSIKRLVASIKKEGSSGQTMVSRGLQETFFVTNIKNYILNKKVWLEEKNLSEQELAILKKTVLPRLHLQLANGPGDDIPTLFGDSDKKPYQILNPIEFVGGAYGYLMGSLVETNLENILQQDTNSLKQRFEKNYFDIFYEQAVLESGLPISRNYLSRWIGGKRINTRIDKYGYLINDLEKFYDPLINSGVLLGDGKSVFPPDFKNKDFTKNYVKKRNEFLTFVEGIKKINPVHGFNTPKILLRFIASGNYGFRSPLFRYYVRDTFLFQTLQECVLEATTSFHTKMGEEAVNNKLILKIPLKLESLLFLGNTFEIQTVKKTLTIRLQAQPVKKINMKQGVSCDISAKLVEAVNKPDVPAREALRQALEVMNKFREVSLDFYKYLCVSVLDRKLFYSILEEQKTYETPKKIKKLYKDDQKMIVGYVRASSLTKLLNFDFSGVKSELRVVNNQPLPKFIESALSYRSVVRNLNDKIETIKQVKELLNRFSKTLKKGKEWNHYSKLLETFEGFLKLPLDRFDSKVLRQMSDLSQKFYRLVSKREYKDNAIAILHAKWKRKNPEKTKNIYFYSAFMEDDVNIKSNLLNEIRRTYAFLGILKRKKCLILFMEKNSSSQIKQVVEVRNFIMKQKLKLEIFIETTVLDEGKIRELSMNVFPKVLFKVDELASKGDSQKTKKTGQNNKPPSSP